MVDQRFQMITNRVSSMTRQWGQNDNRFDVAADENDEEVSRDPL